MRMNEIEALIDDGQRAYRLGKSIGVCPKFDNPIHIKAWKLGFRSAMHRLSVAEVLKKSQRCYYIFP